MNKAISALLFLLLSPISGALAQGLEFQSMNYEIDERTSLNVFAHHPLTFKDRLEISFEMKLTPISRYGYIFRLSNAEDPNQIWNLSYDGRNEPLVIRLNEEGFKSAILAEIPGEELPLHQWVPVWVCFDADADSVHVRIGQKEWGEKTSFKQARFKPTLYFGVSGHVVELPSFSIRDLVIADKDRSVHFPLSEASGQKVRDRNGKVYGRVTNPAWLSNDASHWKPVATLSSDIPGGHYYDPVRHEVGLFTTRGVKKYNINTDRASESGYATPCPIHILLGTAFLKGNALYAYELSDWVEGPGKTSVAKLDLETMQWTALSQDRLDGPMHHHAAFLNPLSGEETFYGGYGDMFFNGDFYTFKDEAHWYRDTLGRSLDPQLCPRFFCSAGVSPDGQSAYIFGGLGNESGEEVVGRRYFYDLHRYDLKTGTCQHLWTIDWPNEPSVPARGLVIRDSCFYALCYPEYLTKSTMYLYRFDLSDGSCDRIGTGIEVDSDKIWCNSNLYFDAALNKLVAVCCNVDRDLNPKIEVYTILFPPINEQVRKQSLFLWIILGAIGAVSLLTLLIRWLRKRSRKRHHLQQEHDRYILSLNDASKRAYRTQDKPNSIYLFGEFTVTDRNGTVITDLFSQQTKALLLLLFRAEDKGISSSRISGILWPDKEPERARNSRGVAVSNLRKALGSLDGINLTYEEGVYRLRLAEPFHLDFYDFKRLISEGDAEGALCILSRGRFLKDTQNHLSDGFKSDAEALIIPFLTAEMDLKMKDGQRLAAIEIADIALEYDPQDELALRHSVAALNALGRRDDALVRYSVFQANWQKLNGEPYPVKFNELNTR